MDFTDEFSENTATVNTQNLNSGSNFSGNSQFLYFDRLTKYLYSFKKQPVWWTFLRWPWGVTFPSAFFYFPPAFYLLSFTFFYFPSSFFYFSSQVFYFLSPFFYFPSDFFFTTLHSLFYFPSAYFFLSLTIFCTSLRHFPPFCVFTPLQ